MVCDGDGKPVVLRLTAGQVSDYRGVEAILVDLPEAGALIADKGYDGDRFRRALAERSIEARIPGRPHRKKPVAFDAELYKQRNLIERMFRQAQGGLEAHRHTIRPMRAHLDFSAVCIAATVIFGT